MFNGLTVMNRTLCAGVMQADSFQRVLTKPHTNQKKKKKKALHMLTDGPASMSLNIGCICTGLINEAGRLKLQQGLQVS